MGSWEKLERTGATLQGECPGCGGVQKFYEAKKKFNVTALFTVSLGEGEEIVVQCGQCLALATAIDSITRSGVPRPSRPPP